MADDLSLTLLGVPVRIVVADAAVRRRLAELWEPCTGPPHDGLGSCGIVITRSAGAWLVEVDGHGVGTAQDLDALLRMVAVEVNSRAVRGCPDLLVHSACVSRGGAGVALADRSGGGKSTLTAACLARGWEYVTDEALRLRADGLVLPYPKPLNLSRSSTAAIGMSPASTTGEQEVLWSVDDLGARARRQPLALTDVVLLQRSASHVEPRLTPLHVADGFTGLLRLAFNHHAAPAQRIELLAAAVARARVWRLSYAEASAAAELLTTALSSGPACASGRGEVPG